MKLPRYHRVKYALAGVLLGLGAPLGSLALRIFFKDEGTLWTRLIQELTQSSYFYIYMTVGTVTAFVLYGYILGEKGDSLEKEKKRANTLAVKDGLTGLYNHRYLQDHLKAELERAKRYGTSLTCMMLDIDDFKKVNDSYGHVFGDHVLKVVARILREQIRRVDTAGRYGGEEFLIIMPQTFSTDVLPVADRIRSEFQEYPFHLDGQVVRVTLSIGIATQVSGSHNFKDGTALTEATDKALYESKRHGKNQTSIWSPLTPTH